MGQSQDPLAERGRHSDTNALLVHEPAALRKCWGHNPGRAAVAAEWQYHTIQVGTSRKGDQPKKLAGD